MTDRSPACRPWLLATAWLTLCLALFTPQPALASGVGKILALIQQALGGKALPAAGPASDGDALTYDSTTDALVWEAGSGSGDLTSITETGDALTITNGTGPVPDIAAHANVEGLADAAATDGNFLVGNGTIFVAESGATARASLGLDTSTADNRLLRADGTTGATQDSGVTLDDSDNMTGVASIAVTNSATVSGNSKGKTFHGTTAAVADLSLDFTEAATQTNTQSTDVAFTTTINSLPPSGSCSAITVIVTSTSGGNITYPSAWRWLGTAPTTLAAGEVLCLQLIATSNAESGVIACATVVGDGS